MNRVDNFTFSILTHCDINVAGRTCQAKWTLTGITICCRIVRNTNLFLRARFAVTFVGYLITGGAVVPVFTHADLAVLELGEYKTGNVRCHCYNLGF